MDRKLHDTIQELKIFKKKQNAEIDDLIVSLQNQATIGAGTIAKPSVEVLRVKDTFRKPVMFVSFVMAVTTPPPMVID